MSPIPGTVLALVAAAGLASSAGAQVLFREDFENGLVNWTAAGLWHVEDATPGCAAPLLPFPSGVKAAWYGSPATCDYSPWVGGGPHGLRLVTPVQLPPAGAHLALRFRRFLESEYCLGGYDFTSFAFSTDGGVSWIPPFTTDCRWNRGPAYVGLPWQTTRVAIDSLAGQSALIAFWFQVDPPFDQGLGWWIDDVEFAVEPGTTACTATTLVCPCQNAWPTYIYAGFENYGGCQNSRRAEAVLYGDGVASVSGDSVVLRVADMPLGAPAILIQGNSATTVPFGDGRSCIFGPLMRLWRHTNTQPIESFPGPGEIGLAARGGVPAGGGVRHYQVVYRDAAAWCTSATWNTSNAYRIEWAP